MAWSNALSVCKASGGTLARITSAEEYAIIDQLIPTNSLTWLNGNDIAAEGSWVYDDGTPMVYFNWIGGEPNNNGDEDCISLDKYHTSTNKQQDSSCSWPLGYACEEAGCKHPALGSSPPPSGTPSPTPTPSPIPTPPPPSPTPSPTSYVPPSSSICIKSCCYDYYQTSMNWADAQSFCQYQGGNIAKISNYEELKAATSITGWSAWVGASTNTTGFWRWTDSSPMMVHHAWDTPEPYIIYNNQPENCLEIYEISGNSVLNDISCDSVTDFLCERGGCVHPMDIPGRVTYDLNMYYNNWTAINTTCKLAKILNAAEQNKLISLLKPNTDFWIGGNKLLSPIWQWADGSFISNNTVSYWESGIGNQLCLKMNTNQLWLDESCTVSLFSVCEVDNPYYVGCFTNSTFSNLYSTPNQMVNPLTCAIACKAHGFIYSGTQNGFICSCGNLTSVQVSNVLCNLSCSGNNLSTCGGIDVLSVFDNQMISGDVIRENNTIACFGDYHLKEATWFSFCSSSIDYVTTTVQSSMNANPLYSPTTSVLPFTPGCNSEYYLRVIDGQCSCVPSCGKCGSDGCGGSCGTCSNGDVCSSLSSCVNPIPNDLGCFSTTSNFQLAYTDASSTLTQFLQNCAFVCHMKGMAFSGVSGTDCYCGSALSSPVTTCDTACSDNIHLCGGNNAVSSFSSSGPSTGVTLQPGQQFTPQCPKNQLVNIDSAYLLCGLSFLSATNTIRNYIQLNYPKMNNISFDIGDAIQCPQNFLVYIESSCKCDCNGKQCGPDVCGGSCGDCSVGSCNTTSGYCVISEAIAEDNVWTGSCPIGTRPKIISASWGSKLCPNADWDVSSSLLSQLILQIGNNNWYFSIKSTDLGDPCPRDTEILKVVWTCEECVNNCTGKLCGPDGCYGVCGTCPYGQSCDQRNYTCGPAYFKVGCFLLPSLGLPDLNVDKTSGFGYTPMTISICQNRCSKYSYFGLRNGTYCSCGNTQGYMSTPTLNTLCNIPCSGQSDVLCGGVLTESIFANSACSKFDCSFPKQCGDSDNCGGSCKVCPDTLSTCNILTQSCVWKKAIYTPNFWSGSCTNYLPVLNILDSAWYSEDCTSGRMSVSSELYQLYNSSVRNKNWLITLDSLPDICRNGQKRLDVEWSCGPTCGDSIIAMREQCDDGNTVSGDGCDSQCKIEPGAVCGQAGYPCSAICGDGILVPLLEECDPALSPSCSTKCKTENNSNSNIAGVVIGVICSILALLIIFFVYWRFFRLRKDFALLPEEITWQYREAIQNPYAWHTMGHGPGKYYYKELNGNQYNQVLDLFENFLQGKTLQVEKITAIYNPTLFSNFSNTFGIMRSRFMNDQNMFFKQSWKEEGIPLAEDVYNFYSQRISFLNWNKDLTVPIIPTCHGTDLQIAFKISQTGFAALSSLDAGWYGKGIYFTTYALYTFPYIATRKEPAIIISYVLPGNVYPTTQHPQKKNSLMGAALKGGYNSHYVCTRRDGLPPSKKLVFNETFDEIVVSQEPFISPAFILEIAKNNFSDLGAKWSRKLPDEEEGRENRKEKQRERKDSLEPQDNREMQNIQKEENPERELTNSKGISE